MRKPNRRENPYPTRIPKNLWAYVLHAIPGLVFFPIACPLLLAFDDWGTTTTLDAVETPDRTLRAWVVDHNEGALGGSTTVWVEHIGSGDAVKVLYRSWIGQPQLSWAPIDGGWRLGVPGLMAAVREYETTWRAFRRLDSLSLRGVKIEMGPAR